MQQPTDDLIRAFWAGYLAELERQNTVEWFRLYLTFALVVGAVLGALIVPFLVQHIFFSSDLIHGYFAVDVFGHVYGFDNGHLFSFLN